MTEKELFEMMYKKHHKWFLNAHETALECGISYSKLSKLFGGKDALSEKIILEKKYIGSKRMWKITEIVRWIIETERKR